jgi:ER lumen protein retaining receptor
MRFVENLTSKYVLLLGIYRILYLINIVYRYFEFGYISVVLLLTGLLQASFYVDFYYYYYKARAETVIHIPPV